MRIALISDIHGNCFALDTALADLRSHSVAQIVCLGDAIQGGPQPAETVQRLRELGCPIVMGNADAWLLAEENDSAEPTSQQQRDVRAWTLSKLSSDDLAFIRSFQPTVEVALAGGQRLLCFHGSPTSYDDILLPDTSREDWQRFLGPFAPAIMTGGHTHTQQMRRVGEGLFFNPGSIGLVYDVLLPKDQIYTSPWAEYAILTHEQGRLSLDFHRAPYDVEQLIQVIQASGRPHADAMIADYRRDPKNA
ncbi:MAG TPA: metallophosphoesterase family protein [Ktedonobacterales bacterium]|jgi:predicted phosphodiesterase